MNFNQSVDGNKVLDVLKVAAKENKFGNYTVKSINLIASSSTVTPSTPGRVSVFVFMKVYNVTLCYYSSY